MTERITSRANPLIRHVRRLREDRGYRYREKAFVADGTKLLEEALRWNVPLQTVLLREDLSAPALPEGTRVIRLPESLMEYVSRMEAPQGVLFVCSMPEQPILCPQPGTLILDGIQDPGNLGAILRTADAWSVPVILGDGCADPYGEKAVRASMGAIFRSIPMRGTGEEILSALNRKKIPLWVTALAESTEDVRQVSLQSAAVVVGSEGRGVSPFFLTHAEKRIIIPMTDRCESLNAAVAAAVILWEMSRGE